MPLSFQEFNVNNFAGGITDKYISSPLNKMSVAKNFLITESASLITRPGFSIFYDQEALLRIMGMYDFNDDLIVLRGNQSYIHNPLTDQLDLIATPTPASPFFQYTGNTAFPAGIEWRNQLLLTNDGLTGPTQLNRPMRIYRDSLDVVRGLELGLPEFDIDSVTVGFTGTGTRQTTPDGTHTDGYFWSFHYSYEYTVGDSTFSIVGPVATTDTWYLSSKMGLPDHQVDFTTIPVLTSILNQRDNANIKIKIFRTVANGTSSHPVGEITNGTLTFSESEIDSDISEAGIVAYTDGGELDHFPAPKCKYMIIVGNVPYYMYVQDEDSGDIKPSRVIQGFPGEPDSVDYGAFTDMDDEIIGGSHVQGNPIIGTESYVYRLEGTFDNRGGGGIRKRIISETASPASHRSFVRTNNSLFFIGRNGVYVTDGYTVELIPACHTLADTMRSYVETKERRERIVGTYDELNERVYWSVSDNDTENNQWVILNLKTGGITTADAKVFSSSTTVYKDGAILRGDELGYIYKHERGTLSDVVRDSSLPADQWQTTHIPFEFEHVANDYGSPAMRKWINQNTFTIKSDTNYSILPAINNDDRRVVREMREIRSWGTFFWDDPTFVWGDPEIKWRKRETDSSKRHTPKGAMRCRRKQYRLEPAETIVYKSDNYDLGDAVYVDPLEPLDFTLTIQGTATWPADAVGYQIVFEESGYEIKHTIISRNALGTELTIGGGDLLPGTDKKWHIVGMFKNQEFEIKSITSNVSMIANEGNEFQSGDQGANDG